MLDTIWFDVETSGYVTDYPRTISFEQMAVDSNAAIPDVHYVAFDNPELQNVYVVPAHSTRVRVPLVVKKDDPELEKKQFILRFCIKENKFFKTGFPTYRVRTVRISNMLTQPKHWDMYAEWYFAGEYGPVKYRFMIDAGAKVGVTIDDDFFAELLKSNPPDMGLTGYWQTFFENALAEENAKRKQEEKKPLAEANGKEVTFSLY